MAMTGHALVRARERGISRDEIIAAFHCGERFHDGVYGDAYGIQHGSLRLILGIDNNAVITLWRNEHV